jgi:predicted DNA-binding protein with PD1-like motif
MGHRRRFHAAVLLVLAVCAFTHPTAVSKSVASVEPSATVYNSVADLLAGDLWEVTTVPSVLAGLPPVPSDWPLMGVGTTDQTARNGEVFVLGTVASPEILWVDSDYPQPVRAVTKEQLPFLAIAWGDPAKAIVASASPGQPLHAQVQALAELHGLTFAGVRVSGRFQEASYSVAYNLEKHGTPLVDPSADKARYQLLLSAQEPAEWEFSGFYAAAKEAQALVSVVGAPVHLHGTQVDRARAGHLGAAIVESAEIRLYPLSPPIKRQCDLTIIDLQIVGDSVTFQAVNIGANTVTHASVEGWVGEKRVFQIRVSSLTSGQPQQIRLRPEWGDVSGPLRVVIDPYNELLEANEENNQRVGDC